MLRKTISVVLLVVLALVFSACNLSNLTSKTLRVKNLCTFSLNIYLDGQLLDLVVKGETNDFSGISPQTHTLSARLLNNTLFTSSSVDFSSSSQEWILCP